MELIGIKTGLMVAQQLKFRDVILKTDSIEACRLVNSTGHNFHIYEVILADIHALRARQWHVEILHILRKGNRYANAMAKHRANQEEPLHNQHLPPEGLNDLLAADTAGVIFVRCQFLFLYFFSLYTKKRNQDQRPGKYTLLICIFLVCGKIVYDVA